MGLQHIWKSFLGTSNPELVILPCLVAIIPTSDDLAVKTLEVVRTFMVWGVLDGVLSSKLLKRKVREAIDAVQDPQSH